MKDATFTADRLLALYDRVAEAEDAIPRLRRFVLDLAVRGKLVEQDPSDEPAAELLKRIAKEKARLVKVGEIKGAKPIAMNGEPVAAAPIGWMVVPLGEVINRHLGGGTPSKNDHSYWGGDIRWASVKDVGKSKYVDDTIDRITQKGLENSSSNLIPAGNLIVVTRMGLGQLSINRVPVAINQDLRALFLSPFVDIDFVYNFFLTYGMEGTGLTVKGIKIEELLAIPFPLPPLAEQQRIVAKVDELMELCDGLQAARAGREAVRDRLTAATLTRMTAPETDTRDFPTHASFALQTLPTLTTREGQIKTLRQTILNLAVRGKLVAQDPTDEPAAELLKRAVAAKQKIRTERRIGRTEDPEFSTSAGEETAPQNWVWANLADFALVLGGKRLPAGADFSAEPTDHIYIRVTDMKDGTILSDKLKFISSEVQAQIAKYTIDSEDIYITIAGTIGEVGDVPGAFHGHNLTENAAKIVFREVSTDFLLVVLKSQDVQDQFTEKTKQMAQPKLALKRILGARLPLPPLAEQHRIVAKVDALMALCDQLEASLTTATTTRSRLLEALLHEALNGQTEAAA